MAPRDRAGAAVLALAALALAARFVLLGDRVAHWDEARVAWWILQYEATGTWRYYPILHGPFLFHVNRMLFAMLGPSDFVMRLPVAVVGGLLPASALWFRDHLRDAEVVALAGILAAAPLLVFYSRFMRNDLLLAAFAFAAFGLLLRARATGRRRYLLAAVGLLALGFATKENAVLYLLSWLGAATLVDGARWWREEGARLACDAAGGRRSGLPTLSTLPALGRSLAGRARSRLAGLRAWLPALAVGVVEFVALVVLFYAPRTGGHRPGLEDLASEPDLLPDVVAAATVGAAGRLVDLWLLGGLQDHSYAAFAALLVGLTLLLAPATVLLAGYGLGVELRRPDGRPRFVVAFAAAWAGLGLVGYPLAVDLVAGWTPVHVVVPLAVPAAVGLAALWDRARPALARSSVVARRVADGPGPPAGGNGLLADGSDLPTDGRDRSTGVSGQSTGVSHLSTSGGRLAAVVLVVLVGQALAVGVGAAYLAPDAPGNPYPQPAQATGDLRPTMRLVAAAADGDGPTVAVVGPYFAGGLHRQLPVPWYVRAAGGTRVVYEDPRDLPADPPPVVMTLDRQHEEVGARLSGYRCFAHELDAWSAREPGGWLTETYVYVAPSALPPDGGSTLASHRCG